MSPSYRITAKNTAVQSENKMHDDTVAASFGFKGGLVPGVEVYAYMTRAPAERWGMTWLENGSMRARLLKPVYDGEEITVDHVEDGPESITVTVTNSNGDVCATGGAERTYPGVSVPTPPRKELPQSRPPADEGSLEVGTLLGTYDAGFHADRAGEYLEQVGETLPLYTEQRVAHPGWLIRMANWVLTSNVRLGPWIHVETSTHHLGRAVHDGERVEVRATVADRYEHKGHKFVVLDEVFLAAGREVSYVRHTAIYEPRRERARPEPGS